MFEMSVSSKIEGVEGGRGLKREKEDE